MQQGSTQVAVSQATASIQGIRDLNRYSKCICSLDEARNLICRFQILEQNGYMYILYAKITI